MSTRSPGREGVPREYAAARSGAIVVERADRRVLRVGGRDPVRMLHGLITNDLAGAAENVCVYAAFLTPKGRMVADARLVRTGGAVLVETAAAAEQPLREHLRKYVPPLFARVEDDAGLAVVGVYGPAARVLVAGPATGAGTHAATPPIVLPPLEVPETEGTDILVPRADVQAMVGRLVAAGAVPGGLDTVELLRIEAGLPAWGAELNDGVIPLEAGLKERAISTSKGCYTGQEVIVRILHRGHVNRLLRGLDLGTAPAPPTGAPVNVPGEERTVGRVTSAAVSPGTGRTLALAYVRREVPVGAPVEVTGVPATVLEVPGWAGERGDAGTGAAE